MRAVKKEWLLGMLCVLSGVMLMVMHPVQAQAGQADRAAYRAVFDASYYSAAYPDVAAAYGNNADALLNHFISFGVKEGRNASAEFNPQAYRQRYEDLRSAATWRLTADIMWHMEKPRAETAAQTDSRWRQYSRQTARRSRRTARLGHRTMGQRRAVHRHRVRSRHPAR